MKLSIKQRIDIYKCFGILCPIKIINLFKQYTAEETINLFSSLYYTVNYNNTVFPNSENIMLLIYTVKFFEISNEYVRSGVKHHNSKLSLNILGDEVYTFLKNNDINTFDDILNMTDDELMLFKLQVLS